jgi:hypothetical protein
LFVRNDGVRLTEAAEGEGHHHGLGVDECEEEDVGAVLLVGEEAGAPVRVVMVPGATGVRLHSANRSSVSCQVLIVK